MIRLLFICLGLLYAMPSCTEVVAAHTPSRSAIPALRVTNEKGTSDLQIAKLAVEVSITGNIAVTTFDIEFYNPADKILEGEFDFPLADGQNVIRYALDINGHLREGVVVEKAAARAAVENTIRRKIDPGLVEKTQGNNFRTRIYPIPAKGYKRVVIGMEQPLEMVEKGLAYQLPLLSAQPLKDFAINMRVYKSDNKPQLPGNSLSRFAFKEDKEGWVASFHAVNFKLANTVACVVPEEEATVYTETFDGRTYFYVHTRTKAAFTEQVNPAVVSLLWDVSASAASRNTKKEMALLEAYCRRLQNVTIRLIPFHIAVLPAENFVVKNGDAAALVRRLQSYELDGGTQLGALELNRYAGTEILLFSDGLSTFGKREMITTVPVTAISSSPNTDYSYLKQLVQQTGGRFINLAATETNTALDEMAKQPFHFISATYNGNAVAELAPQTDLSLRNGFAVAGILQTTPAVVQLHFGYGNQITETKTITIEDDGAAAGNIRRLWAGLKIAQLDLKYDENKAAITQLGKQFSIVTCNTSLLVLDRVEDYVQYEITPPAELKKEYDALLKEKLLYKTDDKALAKEEAVNAVKELSDWYLHPLYRVTNLHEDGIDYDQVFTRVDTSAVVMDGNAATTFAYSTNPTDAATSTAPAPQLEMSKFTPPQIVADEEVKADERPPEQERLAEMRIGTINQEGMKDEGIVAPPEESGSEVGVPAYSNKTKAAIELKTWNPDVVYLKELKKTTPDHYQEKYLLLKKAYLQQPSFFVDVARFFYEKNQQELALQALSNIAEMKLENPELLRIVANQLLEFGKTELAAATFEEVVKIREEEPQSYRDLALTYNELGKYQQAVDLLYKVVTGVWDSRFSSVRGIALNEMNAIISAHPTAIHISAIDPQFIHPMPMDVRIVISWSSNDSDIDLWVTDPAKEKCYYQHNFTRAGGKISGDITQGYGPEEFCVKKGRKGNYEVAVNLYGDSRQTLGGPITIKAELFTHFGMPDQQRKMINLRVTTNKEVIRVGSLQFGN